MFQVIRNFSNNNSSRIYLEQFAKQAADSLDPESIILDAGAGECLYKHLFEHVIYESTDFCKVSDAKYGSISFVSELSTLPVEDNRYDLVLCTQVLEHVPNPSDVLNEFYRVLKPGKELWLSAPLFYEEHQEPFDFYRYTQYGLNYLIENAGFCIKRIEWLEGYYGTLSYQLKMAAKTLPIHLKEYGGGIVGILSVIFAILLKPIFFILAPLLGFLDFQNRFTKAGMCKNYIVVAERTDLTS